MIKLSISYQWALEASTDYFKDYTYPIIYDKTNESNILNFVLKHNADTVCIVEETLISMADGTEKK